jgi:hypothetical protein
MFEKLFKRDTFLVGIALGIVLPGIFYLLLYLIDLVVFELFNTHMLAKQEYLYLLSIAINLFAIKYYFVNLQYDKTGRGILIVTFVLAIFYFVLN